MEQFLLEKIETLRLQMVQEALVHSSLTNENVIAISHELDRYISLYQKLKVDSVRVIEQYEKKAAAY
ncbi:aspartyl-phosphate phosphatase Spo0E family protein [Paenibacillus qinlingensis]|uniref:Aspartyl-phosphate phosphatase Spo0E family protein n=1 Tax=Paenibacillus qinlingensis TaxID=1837343 RepID=A0ABU1P056_9BACL|nr:aspartyl-phosphate phosphatase Spo0E family protein [Paenibacillus qinlingensis]MDR6552647.1 hypothetical protein [Paenibacillus qinlingensis]